MKSSIEVRNLSFSNTLLKSALFEKFSSFCGTGIHIHEKIDDDHYYSFAEYRNVPLALFILDSLTFPMLSEDAEFLNATTPDDSIAWAVYFDSAFRLRSTRVDPADYEEMKDLIKGQVSGTCPAMSIWKLLKSELPTRRTYDRAKLRVSLELIKNLPNHLLNKGELHLHEDILKVARLLPNRVLARANGLEEKGIVPAGFTKYLMESPSSDNKPSLSLEVNDIIGALKDFKFALDGSKLIANIEKINLFTVFLTVDSDGVHFLNWSTVRNSDKMMVKVYRDGQRLYKNAGELREHEENSVKVYQLPVKVGDTIKIHFKKTYGKSIKIKNLLLNIVSKFQ